MLKKEKKCVCLSPPLLCRWLQDSLQFSRLLKWLDVSIAVFLCIQPVGSQWTAWDESYGWCSDLMTVAMAAGWWWRRGWGRKNRKLSLSLSHCIWLFLSLRLIFSHSQTHIPNPASTSSTVQQVLHWISELYESIIRTTGWGPTSWQLVKNRGLHG